MHVPVDGDPTARCHRCGDLLRLGWECKADAAVRTPQRELDIREVGVGTWVWIRGSVPTEGKGGLVVSVDRVVDQETGETFRVFHTAMPWQGHIRWDTLREDNVGDIGMGDSADARRVWRTMAGYVAKRRGAVKPEELRLGETIHILMRSFA